LRATKLGVHRREVLVKGDLLLVDEQLGDAAVEALAGHLAAKVCAIIFFSKTKPQNKTCF